MIYWLIFGMAFITFVNRYAFFANSIHYRPSKKVRRFLSYSSYAVLTAIWTPIVFQLDTNGGVSHAGVDYILACSTAALLSILRLPSLVIVLLSAVVFLGLRFYLY